MRYDLRILRAVRRIMRAVDQYSRKLSTGFGITGPQMVCLMTISEEAPLTAAELSRSVFLSESTLVGILDRLQRKGYIHRERSQQDRRRVYITLTPRGQEVVLHAPSPLQDQLIEGLNGLPESEQASIASAMERVVGLMEVNHIDAAPMLDGRDLLAPPSASTRQPRSQDTDTNPLPENP